jgi:colanic acid biosynthesis glycosyl transferase WcaI
MRILVVSQYYPPEDVGAAVYLSQLTHDLAAGGHRVTMLTGFPNYPERRIFKGYRKRLYQRETIDGIEVIRTWLYANPSESYGSRALNWGTFCLSSFAGGILAGARPDVVLAILPPLPLGVTSILLARLKRAHVVCAVEDIYPLIAVELGILKSRLLIRFFSRMERWVYRHSDGLVAISEGFRRHLVEEGAEPSRTGVVPNWADAEAIRPSDRMTPFRRELHLEEQFLVLYSGSLSHNSSVEALVAAASELGSYPITILIVGDGVRRKSLEDQARGAGLRNVVFVPFQPLSRYPDVLASADISVVTLNTPATLASVPSKIFKQMAAGRPILAITEPGNELDRMVTAHQMGVRASPRDPSAVAAAILALFKDPERLREMGANGRRAVEEVYSRKRCTGLIEAALRKAVR